MIPNHFNHTTNINNLWTRSYQKIKPLNTTKIISFRFGFVPWPTFFVSVCLLPWQFPILGLRGARYVTQPVIMVTNKFYFFKKKLLRSLYGKFHEKAHSPQSPGRHLSESHWPPASAYFTQLCSSWLADLWVMDTVTATISRGLYWLCFLMLGSLLWIWSINLNKRPARCWMSEEVEST